MKCLKILLLSFTLLASVQMTSQVTGTPYVFKGQNAEEPVIGYSYDLDQLEDNPSYMYTMKIIYKGSDYKGSMTWSSDNEDAATIDENGIVIRIGFAFEPVIFKGIIDDGPLKSKQLSISLDLSPNGGFDGIIKGTIATNPIVLEYTETPINFILFPSGNIDNSAIYTVSDPSVAKIVTNNGRKLKALNEGTIRIIGQSSINPSIRDTLDIKINNVIDTRPPVITLENAFTQDTLRLQRSASNTIPKATAYDEEYGDFPVTITEKETSFDGEELGHYTVNYYAIDDEKNETSEDLVIQIMDTIPPTLNLIDTSIAFKSTIKAIQGSRLFVPKANSLDDDDSVVEVVIDSTGYSADVEGLHAIYYTATDPAGNVNLNELNLEIKAGGSPEINIDGGYVDGDVITINEGQEFLTPTAIATDAVGNEVAITVNIGELNVLTPGMYPIKYTATDRFERSTEVNLTLKVKDISAPKITNGDDFTYLERVITNAPVVITQVLAEDNVGITQYTIQEVSGLESNAATQGTYGFRDGTIGISSDGSITATLPDKAGYGDVSRYIWYFRIEALDAEGNKDTAFLKLRILNEGQAVPIVEARESEALSWEKLSYKATDGDIEYEITKNIRFKKDSILFHLKSEISFADFEKYELTGVGAEDFYFENHAAGTPLEATTQNIALKSKIIFPEDGKNYQLRLTIHTTFPTSTIPIDININVETLEDLAPALPELIANLPNAVDPVTGGVIIDPITKEPVKEIMSIVSLSKSYGIEPPNSNIFPGFMEVFSSNLLDLPVMDNALSELEIKKLIKKLPYALWISVEGNLVRTYVKFNIKGITVQIEFIADKDNDAAYFNVEILPPSKLSTKLRFLDHLKNNIVFTNNTVNMSNFKCLPLLTKDPLKAGIHLIGRGTLFPTANIPASVTNFINPIIEARISVSEAGWTVPDLTFKMKLEADFISKFDEKIVEYLVGEAGPAQQAIKASQEAARIAYVAAIEARKVAQFSYDAALRTFNLLRPAYLVQRRIVNGPKYALQALIWNRDWAIRTAKSEREKEWCGPGCYDFPYPKWCKVDLGLFDAYYPCGIGYREVCLDVCVPDPIAQAFALTLDAYALAKVPLIEAQRLITEPLVEELNRLYKIPLDAARLALDNAGIPLRLASEALSLAYKAYNESAELTAQGLGTLGSFALDIINKIKLVETSSASIETTLSAANSGTFSGTLEFGISIRGAGSTTKSAGFSFSDPLGSTINVAKSIIE